MAHRVQQHCRFKPAQRRPRAAAALVLCCAGCVELNQEPLPEGTLFGAVEPLAQEVAGEQPFVGLTLEERVAGSLEDLVFETGLRVVRVAAGSPAERAGIRPGDLIVEADQRKVSGLDGWQAVLAGRRPGEELALGVERDQGLRQVQVEVQGRAGGVLPPATRFAERLKARVVLETVAGERGIEARVAELLPGSPLAAAGIAAGARIERLNGAWVRDAATLAKRLAAAPYGAEVTLDVQDAGGARSIEVELYEPERRLTALRVPILFRFERDLAGERSEFAVLDLWIVALYDYRRQMSTVRHRILRFFAVETGVGELEEETPASEAAAPRAEEPK